MTFVSRCNKGDRGSGIVLGNVEIISGRRKSVRMKERITTESKGGTKELHRHPAAAA
jgi:hypothetical protein